MSSNVASKVKFDIDKLDDTRQTITFFPVGDTSMKLHILSCVQSMHIDTLRSSERMIEKLGSCLPSEVTSIETTDAATSFTITVKYTQSPEFAGTIDEESTRRAVDGSYIIVPVKNAQLENPMRISFIMSYSSLHAMRTVSFQPDADDRTDNVKLHILRFLRRFPFDQGTNNLSARLTSQFASFTPTIKIQQLGQFRSIGSPSRCQVVMTLHGTESMADIREDMGNDAQLIHTEQDFLLPRSEMDRPMSITPTPVFR